MARHVMTAHDEAERHLVYELVGYNLRRWSGVWETGKRAANGTFPHVDVLTYGFHDLPMEGRKQKKKGTRAEAKAGGGITRRSRIYTAGVSFVGMSCASDLLLLVNFAASWPICLVYF
jgi:hypothetical protein